MLIPDSHAQRRRARADRKRPVSQLTCQVERLHRRLLAREAQRVLGHLRLDRCAHGGSGSKEPIRRCEPFEFLMGALEVVVLDEQPHPPLAVLEVGEHRPRQQLFPQRLPEPLDLPAGLGMVRPALHMLDAVALKLRLELRAPTPRGVLAALIGQDLPRRSVLGDAAAEGFEHQHASLVVRDRHTHQVARVIIQERRHIQPLVPSQQERKDVRLPQLVRLRPLEVLHHRLAPYSTRRPLRLDPLALQDPAHRRRRHPDPQEPPHHISDAPSAGRWMRLPGCHDRLRLHARRLLQVRPLRRLTRFERPLTALSIPLYPHHRCRVRHA